MNAPIRDTDKGYKALMARLAKAASGARVTVGIHEAEGSKPAEGDSGDATLIEVAAYNEFGGPATDEKPLGNPPRRSFIADWEDESVDEHREQLRKIGQAIVKGTIPSVEVGLDRFGLHAVGEVQQRIKAGIEPENAESTIERKGSSTPLIASGQLWTSVTHHVESGSSSGEGSG